MTTGLVAGVDCSTQATKVVIADPESGEVVAMGRAPHEVTGAGGRHETDPHVWWSALAAALAATGRARDVRAIAVAGQQHGLVTLDKDGDPLHPAILWNDTRSAAEAVQLTAALGGPLAWAERVGVVPVASFTVTKWAWLQRHRPDVAAAATALMLPHDYLTYRLTGAHVTDRGDVSGTGWWSTATEGYLDDVLDLPDVRLDPARLPTVLGPDQPAGEVTSEAAAALGLAPGALVGPGTGDNMGAALGLGLEPGTPALSLGTSGTVFMVAPERVVDASGVVAGFADATGRYLPLACTLNCTLAIDRLAALMHVERDAVEPGGEVVMLPYLDGERTPDLPHATGTVVGLRHDTTSGQLLQAAYDGAVASLLDALDLVSQQAGGLADSAPIVLVGGGARGRAWQDTVRRLSGRPVVVPYADGSSPSARPLRPPRLWRACTRSSSPAAGRPRTASSSTPPLATPPPPTASAPRWRSWPQPSADTRSSGAAARTLVTPPPFVVGTLARRDW